MGLGVAMSTAVFAIRRAASEIDCIARRPGWRIETAVNSRGWLAISVLVPPESEREWQDVPRTGTGIEVPLAECSAAVVRIAEACMNVLSNRGIDNGHLRVFLRSRGERNAWALELTFPVPDRRQQWRLKNHR